MAGNATSARLRGVRSCGWLMLLLCLAPAAVEGQAPSDRPRVRLSLEYDYFDHIRREPSRIDTRSAVTAVPRVDWSPSDALAFRVSALLRKDWSMRERTRADLYDTTLTLEHGAVAIVAGRQFITWGRADSLRPTDVFKRHDVTDLLENQEWPIDAVKVDLQRGSATLEAVWVPIFSPDLYSVRGDNRWSGLPVEADLPGIGRVPQTYRRDTSMEPPRSLESGQGGLRFSATARGWDFAGMVYRGFDRVPTTVGVGAVELGDSGTTVALVPVHRRISVVGGDLATAVGGWGLRGEAAYTRNEPVSAVPSGRNPSFFRLTAGLDRMVSPPVGDSLMVVVQYALDTTRPEDVPFEQRAVNPLLHPFRHAVVLNSEWRFTTAKRLTVKGYWNPERGDYVLQPEWSWQPRDAFTWLIGADVVGGPDDSFFGRFDRNDRLRLRLSYNF